MPATVPDPEQIGPYRILERLGEGGMGVVYLAVQQEPVRRQVALKVIKPGMDTERVVRRFEAERQALALMDHPGIARIHDAGATAEGRPWFAMEVVAGADPSAGVRADAARALGRMDSPETHRLLRERLLADPDAHVRARLAESLEHVGAPTDEDLQTALLALRRETGERAQSALARLLADHLVRIPQAEADLTRLLHGSERLRRDLAERLPRRPPA